MPIPALNIIATQDTVRNSGRSSSVPSRIRPKRLKARTIANTRKTAVASTNTQPKVAITQLSTSSATVPRDSVSRTPHRTNAAEIAAAM